MEHNDMESYMTAGALIPEKDWRTHIDTLRTSVADATPMNEEDLMTQWMAAFERAVISRAQEAQDAKAQIGVLFSGGLDSSLICVVLQKNGIPFICYTAGYQDPTTKEPEDIIEARKVAQHYGWRHKEVVLTIDELKPTVEETVVALENYRKGLANPITTSVGAVVVAAARLAYEDGVTHLFGGLGSEEIFAGYRRHERARDIDQDINEECWRGLHKMYERDLLRDCALAAHLSITVHTPFLDDDVVRLAMMLPGSAKLVGDDNKAVLRAMAVRLGLDERFAARPKRAAQYGSRFNKGILRLAWAAGLDKKGEFLEKIIPTKNIPLDETPKSL